MKNYFYITLIIFSIFIKNVNGLTYEDVDQKTVQYNINNFYLEEDFIIINGWAVTSRHQHFLNNETHEYSMLITNKKTNVSKTYIATLKKADKTKLMNATEEITPCKNTYIPNGNNCYYDYSYSGFEIKIPIHDLEKDSEYDIKLRLYEKTVNKAYQLSIYALGIDSTYIKDNIRYQLYSDINKTSVSLLSDYLYVRSGPGQNYSLKYGDISCSNSKVLYWYPSGYFSTILDTYQTNKGSIDSELWLNLGYNQYKYCLLDKARVYNGTKYNGWAPWIYMIGKGTPATIKTTSVNNFSIDELKTYTVKKNTNSKVAVTITNTINEQVKIVGYYNDNIVYSKEELFVGTKTFIINYLISESGIFKIVVSNKNKTLELSSNIFISSEKIYYTQELNEIIKDDIPILVITDKNGDSKEYYESFKFNFNKSHFEISQGQALSEIESSIQYFFPLDEFSLNSDYEIYSLYPSQDNNLNYETFNNKTKVTLIKNSIIRENNYDFETFKSPITYINLKGNLHSKQQNNYYNGGYFWYPSWNDKIGTHDFEYVITNLGVNKVTIIQKLQYSITSTMFGNYKSKYKIKRIKNPKNLNIIFKKTFKYDELIDYVKENQ